MTMQPSELSETQQESTPEPVPAPQMPETAPNAVDAPATPTEPTQDAESDTEPDAPAQDGDEQPVDSAPAPDPLPAIEVPAEPVLGRRDHLLGFDVETESGSVERIWLSDEERFIANHDGDTGVLDAAARAQNRANHIKSDTPSALTEAINQYKAAVANGSARPFWVGQLHGVPGGGDAEGSCLQTQARAREAQMVGDRGGKREI